MWHFDSPLVALSDDHQHRSHGELCRSEEVCSRTAEQIEHLPPVFRGSDEVHDAHDHVHALFFILPPPHDGVLRKCDSGDRVISEDQLDLLAPHLLIPHIDQCHLAPFEEQQVNLNRSITVVESTL